MIFLHSLSPLLGIVYHAIFSFGSVLAKIATFFNVPVDRLLNSECGGDNVTPIKDSPIAVHATEEPTPELEAKIREFALEIMRYGRTK